MTNNFSSIGILKKIYFYLAPQRKKDLFILFFLSILTSFAESISIAILIPFIGFFINPSSYLVSDLLMGFFDAFNINTTDDLLKTISFLFIAIVIISGFIKIKFVRLSNNFSENITSDFRRTTFDFFIKQNFSYHAEHGSNKIMTSVFHKSKHVSLIVFHSLNILNSIIVSVAIISILFIFNPLNTGIIVLSTSSFFFIYFKIQAISVSKKGKEISLRQNFEIDIYTNTVGYLAEIILYNLRSFYSKLFRDTSEKTAKLQADINSIGMQAKYYFETFIVVFVIAFIYLGNLTEKSVEMNISYFAILAFAAQKCLPLINGIYKSSIIFKGAAPIILDALSILDNTKFESKSIDGAIENKQPIFFKDKIKVEKVKFQYDKNLPYILNNVNFEINKGDKIAIKGKTGAGKSTLTNIIIGLLNPTEGKLIIDDIEINKNNLLAWQKNIAIVPQSIFLNDATILENIAISESLNKINLEKIRHCTKLAQIDSFIETLPGKYNEKIGERGVKLSGGQRQRIGIARALYRDANLIILDEPTNALDAETEKKVMDSLANLKATIIMVSHSDTSLKYFDKIIDVNEFE